MIKYNPSKIEKKWQKEWEKEKLYVAKDKIKGKKNFMLLVEFPYPSGDLHIGHWDAFAVPDILARYLRMKGHNVMYPMGFDAFGLPAENAAIQRDINPADWTKQNISYMTEQLKSMGAGFDWSRKVETIDPEYYKWTQWMFLKFYENGLAYRAKTKVNWCPKDRTVLANEQVINNCCDRCGTPVIQKELAQWMFKITKYADQLAGDLGKLDWPEATKTAQKNWIGKSQGVVIKFQVENFRDHVEVFTTRPDTIFGATFLVLAPEHGLVKKIAKDQFLGQINNYLEKAKKKTELERLAEIKEKTGVFTGAYAVNPANGGKIPVWISDFILPHYGTGAIMAVPAHDERDRSFAQKFNLPISDAPLENMGKIIRLLQEKGAGQPKINYRLHDWIISRQRYWGVPIPVIHCQECGYVPVLEKDLPLKLPLLSDFKPADGGRSPLAKAAKWLKVKCPKCQGPAERETDTMDTFVDSSWYFFRYADPKNKKTFADKKKINAWLPVPMYVGGSEHNTMHLLYSRFFTKALYGLGYINFSEPFLGRRNHGIILGPDGYKMSKSRGNVVNPDEYVKKLGADAVRMYLSFMGPYDQGGPWNPKGINGVYRFLSRVWNLIANGKKRIANGGRNKEIDKVFHKATKKIGEDIENLRFNTAVSELMKLLNELENSELIKPQKEIFLKLLAPFAPHLAEELWREVLGNKKSIHLEKWPKYNPELIEEEMIDLVIQINGRTRDAIKAPRDLSEIQARELALTSEKVKKYIAKEKIKRLVYVSNRLINFVV